MLLAIHRDQIQLRDGRIESYADRWVELAHAWGHQVRLVDAFAPNVVEQVRGADAFLWRFGHDPEQTRLAKRLIPALSLMLRGCVFPDAATCWHYDDKLAQKLLFDAASIPSPRTWLFWRYAEALEFCRTATYPLVVKLSGGAGSENVFIVRSPEEAVRHVEQMFRVGVPMPGWASKTAVWPLGARMRAGLRLMLTGRPPVQGKGPESAIDLHNTYLYAQEFLAGNDFDTRVTVIGHRAFAFRRFNRPNDFRASGSGNFSTDPAPIDPRFIRLAFRVARSLGMQSVAIDGLKRGNEPVVGEVSYAFVSRTVHDCPGHWELRGDPETSELVWVAGQMWPEEAILADLLARIGGRA